MPNNGNNAGTGVQHGTASEFGLLFDPIDTQVWSLQADDAYSAANRAHAHFFGLEPAHLLGHTLPERLPAALAEPWLAIHRPVWASGQALLDRLNLINTPNSPHEPPAPPPASRPATEPTPEGASTTGTVLLVEDEESVRRLSQRMIERLGFRVLTAVDGVDAVEVFRAHADEIDRRQNRLPSARTP